MPLRCLRGIFGRCRPALVVSKDQIVSSGGNGLEIWYDNQNQIDTEI